METKRLNELYQFLIIGFLFCFILKNFMSISIGTTKSITMDIDPELWCILSIVYILSIKVYYKEFFIKVILYVRKYKIFNQILDIYSRFRKTKLFSLLTIVILFILGIISFGLAASLFDNDSSNIKVNLMLFLFLTFIFNKHFNIIGFNKQLN